MGWLLNIILLLIWLACVIMSLASGLWGNVIMVFNVVIAALVATNYFEPVADFLDKQMPSFTYFWDFVAIWLLFAAVCGVLRTFTDTLSKVRVRFKKPIEIGGGLFFGAAVGWIMVCLTLFSLHASPLHPAFLGGGFNPFERMFFGTAPTDNGARLPRVNRPKVHWPAETSNSCSSQEIRKSAATLHRT